MEMITQWMGRNVDTFTRDEAITALKLACHMLESEAKILKFSHEIKSYDPRGTRVGPVTRNVGV